MSSAERQRRFLDKIRGTGTAAASSQLEAECAKLKSENTKLKSENLNLQRLLDVASERIKKMEAPEPKAPTVIELDKRKVIKLELTPKEFKILQRAINPECQATEESNAAVMFIQSFKARHSSIKEIPQPY